MIYIYLLYIKCYLLMYFSGYFLKVVLLDKPLKKLDLFITPWLGLGVIVVGLSLLSLLGFSVDKCAWWFIGGILFLNIFAYLRTKELIIFDKNEFVTILVLGFITSTMYGFVIALNNFNSLTQITINTDFLAYLSIVKHFLFSTISNMPSDGLPVYGLIVTTITEQFRHGVIFISLFSKVFSEDADKITFLVTTFISFLNFSVFRLFLKNETSKFTLIISILCFNTLYQWTVYGAFIGQLFSIGEVAIIIFMFYYLSQKKSFDIKTSLVIVVLLTLLGLSYIEALAFPIAPIIVFNIVVFFMDRKSGYQFLKNCIFIAVLFGITNFKIIVIFFKVATRWGSGHLPWYFPTGTLFDVVGLYFLHNIFDNYIGFIIIINIIFLLPLIMQLKREGFKSFLAITLYAYVVFYILSIYMFLGRSDYQIFKLCLSFGFIVHIFWLRFIQDWLLNTKSIKRTLIKMLFIMIYASNVIASVSFSLLTSNTYGVITKDHEALKVFSDNSIYSNSKFFVDCSGIWSQASAQHFLPMDRTQAVNIGLGKVLNLETLAAEFKQDDFYIASSDVISKSIFRSDTNLMLENNTFCVFKLKNTSMFLNSSNGLSAESPVQKNDETNINYARPINSPVVELNFVSNSDFADNFYATFINQTPDEDVGIDIFFNDKNVGSSVVSGKYHIVTLNNMDIRRGLNQVKFTIKGNIRSLSLADLHFGNYYDEVSVTKNVQVDAPMTKIVNFITETRMKLAESKKIPIDDMKSIVNPTLNSDDDKVIISIKNLSHLKWESKGVYPVNIEYRILDKDEIVVFSGRLAVDIALKPGDSRNYEYANIKSLPPNACYMQFQLVQDRVSYFPVEILETNVSTVKLQK